jgi:hypothetical protein
MLLIAARIATVPFLKLRDCVSGSYHGFVWMSRISRSYKLICAKQADYDEAGGKLRLFHGRIYEAAASFDQFQNEVSN